MKEYFIRAFTAFLTIGAIMIVLGILSAISLVVYSYFGFTFGFLVLVLLVALVLAY